MQTWVALLRGVNVGGHRRLPMAALRAALSAAGFGDVLTYVQSGNVVFRAAPGRTEEDVAAAVARCVLVGFGLDVPVVVRTGSELADVAARHPWRNAEGATSARLHVAFFHADPDPAALAALDLDRGLPDRLALGRRELFAHTPFGLGRSKVLVGLERRLGTALTVRNLATVDALVAMCPGDAPGAPC